MRRVLVVLAAVTALTGTADAAAPVRGAAFCWDFDVVGTDEGEHHFLTAGPEHVALFGGDDHVELYGGDDCASGGRGTDVLHMGPGDDEADAGDEPDHVRGGPGNDVLLAGLGGDDVDGGEGDDLIRDERGDSDPDKLVGGPGHDVLRAANAGPDLLDCGPGWDVAIADPADTLVGCDDVHVTRRPPVAARALRTGVRPSFAPLVRPGDLPGPGRIEMESFASTGPRAWCATRGWRLRGASSPRIVWRGRLRACPGVYTFRLTWVVTQPAGLRVACPQLSGAPRGGCRPKELLGSVDVPVR